MAAPGPKNHRMLPIEYYGNLQQITRIFHWFMAAILVGLLSGLVIVLATHKDLAAVIIAISILPVMAAFILIRKGYFEASAIFLALLLLTLITFISTIGLGIHHISILGYCAILIVASLVTKKRTMAFLTLYTVGCVAWLVFGELSGAYQPTVLVRSVPGDFFTASLIIIITAVMVRIMSEALFKSTSQLKKELDERVLAQNNLQQSLEREKQRTQELIASENRFNKILLFSPAAMSITSKDFIFQYVNDSFLEMVGYTRGEVIGKKLQDITLWKNPEEFDRAIALYDAQAGSIRDFEFVMQRNSGETGYAVYSAETIELNGENFTLAAMLDITDRKLAENTLRTLNVELDRRVSDRTRQLESANKELESFSYSVSHDLRAPLRGIAGFSDILVEEYTAHLDETGKNYLHRIKENALLMSRLIDNLLDFSRLNRHELRKETFDPTVLARSVVDSLQFETQGRRVEVVIADLPPCQADPGLLHQVFANLLGNAFKYSRFRENARIEVGWLAKDGEVVYFVKDNGAGFDNRYAEKLFGVFQRLHSPAEFEGTGIGLATVKRILQRHGGRVWAEGEPDQGATFYFTLPGAAELSHQA
jgi:PAS domain S-box-containing protein